MFRSEPGLLAGVEARFPNRRTVGEIELFERSAASARAAQSRAREFVLLTGSLMRSPVRVYESARGERMNPMLILLLVIILILAVGGGIFVSKLLFLLLLLLLLLALFRGRF